MHNTPSPTNPAQPAVAVARSGGLRWHAPALALLFATGVALSPGVRAQGGVYALERTSDGARVSVRVAAHGAATVALAVGSAVVVTLMSVGTVLSAAGEVVAFIPNALGRSLVHNERLSALQLAHTAQRLA